MGISDAYECMRTVMQPLLARITPQRLSKTAGPNFLLAARFT